MGQLKRSIWLAVEIHLTIASAFAKKADIAASLGNAEAAQKYHMEYLSYIMPWEISSREEMMDKAKKALEEMVENQTKIAIDFTPQQMESFKKEKALKAQKRRF